MGLLNSALQIGRSAILSYEGALHIVGNNIAGAGSADYTRLTPQLDPVHGGLAGSVLQPGAGVALTAIQRNIDEALEGRVRLAIGTETSLVTQQGTLARVESLFDDLFGTGVGIRLGEFFSSFDELQNTPEEVSIRDLVINRGILLTDSLRSMRSQLTALAEDIDSQITAVASQADELAREIARLNEEITRAEGGRSTQAAALRDQRDARLRSLSQLFDVSVREQPNGTVNVYIGSETLIQGATVRGLIADQQIRNGLPRTTLRFEDTNQEVTVRGGQLEGLILSRNQNDQIAAIDELASAIIAEVNQIHADGQGLNGYKQLTGGVTLLDTNVPLDSALSGLSNPPRNGSFFMTVADDVNGTPVAFRIDVEADGTANGTTLESLVASINSQVTGVTASITPDLRLQLTADDGFSFTFGYDGQSPRPDTSGVLSALGINTFFTGNDASDIAINETLVGQPDLLAASSSFLPGDGTMAGRIANLSTTGSDLLGGASLMSFYNSVSNRVAVTSAGVRSDLDAAATVLNALQAQRESISGVNLDEEAISLVKYQRAFQGAARFVSAVDEMIAQIIQMVR